MEIKITRKARYKGLKGKFWDVFAEYVRVRDYFKYGTCISCNKKVGSYKELQAGHYMAAGSCGFGLLFDDRNVNGECQYCNGFDDNHVVGYRKNLDIRYGEGTAKSLEDRYEDAHFRGKIVKEWSKREYEDKVFEYEERIKQL